MAGDDRLGRLAGQAEPGQHRVRRADGREERLVDAGGVGDVVEAPRGVGDRGSRVVADEQRPGVVPGAADLVRIVRRDAAAAHLGRERHAGVAHPLPDRRRRLVGVVHEGAGVVEGHVAVGRAGEVDPAGARRVHRRVAAAGHLAAGAEDQADLVRILPGGELARDLRIRDHAVEQALRAVGRAGGGVDAGGIDLEVEAAVRRVGLEVEARGLQLVAQRLAGRLLHPGGEGRPVDLEGEVEAEVRHQVAADQLVAGAVRRRGEGLEREPRRTRCSRAPARRCSRASPAGPCGRRRRRARSP